MKENAWVNSYVDHSVRTALRADELVACIPYVEDHHWVTEGLLQALPEALDNIP